MKFKKTLLICTTGAIISSGFAFAGNMPNENDNQRSVNTYTQNKDAESVIKRFEEPDSGMHQSLDYRLYGQLGDKKPNSPPTCDLVFTVNKQYKFAAIGFANGEVITFQLDGNNNLKDGTVQVFKEGMQLDHEVTALTFHENPDNKKPSYLFVGHGTTVVTKEMTVDSGQEAASFIFSNEGVVYKEKHTNESGVVNAIPFQSNQTGTPIPITISDKGQPAGTGVVAMLTKTVDNLDGKPTPYLYVLYNHSKRLTRTDNYGFGVVFGPKGLINPYPTFETDDNDNDFDKKQGMELAYLNEDDPKQFNSLMYIKDENDITATFLSDDNIFIGYANGSVWDYELPGIGEGPAKISMQPVLPSGEMKITNIKYDFDLHELFVTRQTDNDGSVNIYGIPFLENDEFLYGQKPQLLQKNSWWVHAITLHGNSIYASSSRGNDNEIWQYSINSTGKVPNVTQTAEGHKMVSGWAITNVLTVSPNGTKLIAGNTDGAVEQINLDPNTGKMLDDKPVELQYAGNKKTKQWGYRPVSSITFIGNDEMQVVLGEKTDGPVQEGQINNFQGYREGPAYTHEITTWGASYIYKFSTAGIGNWVQKTSNLYCDIYTKKFDCAHSGPDQGCGYHMINEYKESNDGTLKLYCPQYLS